MTANTTIVTIKTSQAPDAKPIAANLTLLTEWQKLIEVPQYEIPELIFGGSTTIEPGVAEVISPLLICNTSSNTAYVDVVAYRYEQDNYWYIVKNLIVPSYDTIPVPINGQFFKTGDTLEIKSNVDFAVDVTLSYTLGQAEKDDV